jgi:hypothetical protein
MKKIKELTPLRNKSILGHGYEGVSRERVETLLKGQVEKFLDDDLRKSLAPLGVAVADDDDPLREVVAWLRRKI